MMRGRFLFVLWCSNILAAAGDSTDSAGSVSRNPCLSDYVTNITCSWNITNGPLARSNSYCLMVHRKNRIFSCPVKVTQEGFFCTCAVKDNFFSTNDKYNISLCNGSACQMFQRDFCPTTNIKLSPAPEVELKHSNDSINMTCESKRYQHGYLKGHLDYEILLQQSKSIWKKSFMLSFKTFEILPKSQLKPNTEYCVKARLATLTYQSTWSEWSEPKCWINKRKGEQEHIVSILLKYLSPFCVTFGILLFVLYNPQTRMKIKTLARTPTPAPFFKHEGNLKEWLSPHGKQVLTFKTEEDLVADAVTVVPKCSPKVIEESQVFLSAPETQLLFPPSPTTYVGLPGVDKASPSMHVAYPGDTPYTQLPCSVWGFAVQEVEAVCSDPKSFLEISHCDSGCSCEDLTQSPECSLPCSPVDEIPTPSCCIDYCILNKTAEGVVPVLLSKERAGDVPPNPPKSEG